MEKSKWYLGVDPGKTGGLVLINNVGEIISTYTPKLIGNEVDIIDLDSFIRNIKKNVEEKKGIIHMVIEEVHSIFNSSAKSNFTFGFMVGLAKYAAIANLIPHTYIQPKEWQKEVWLNSEIEREPSKTDAKGREKLGSIKTKIVSLKAAKRLFPNESFLISERSKKPHEGLIDAALIAEAGRRRNF